MKYIKNKCAKVAWGWGKDLAIALIVVTIVTTFFMQNLRVQGTSMAPLLDNSHMVIINKFVYKFKSPQRGEIVGFHSDNVSNPVVKRIIGMPGDLIDYRNEKLYVNGTPINNEDKNVMMHGGDIKYPFTVPQDTYFVLGDNYNNSIDSRFNYIGCVPRNKIIGRIDMRIWPFWKNPFLKEEIY